MYCQSCKNKNTCEFCGLPTDERKCIDFKPISDSDFDDSGMKFSDIPFIYRDYINRYNGGED